MPPSFRSIDYSLRPAKHAERKMLLELFRRLAVFSPLRDYRYVGLGSVWFSDFVVVHRSLGLSDMVSIERERSAEQRIRANIPFAAIQPIFQTTSSAIPLLDWSKRQIVWLDYDDPISPAILADVSAISSRLISGSMLVVSVQHHHAIELDDLPEDSPPGSAERLFKARYTTDVLPPDLSESDMRGRPFGKLSREMIHVTIEREVAVRNTSIDAERQSGLVASYKRICNIEYADGAPMTTTAGLVHTRADEPKFAAMGLYDVDFLHQGPAVTVRIEVPKITPAEARLLEQQLPRGPALECGHIPAADADAFARLYRYLPNFAHIER